MIAVMHMFLLKELLLSEEIIIDRKSRSLAFKNNTPLIGCISKYQYCINNAEDRRFRFCNAIVQFN